MKTSIFITALMITFSTCVTAAANPLKSEDSLFTAHLASINGSFSSESDEDHALNHNFSDLNPTFGLIESDAKLEDWIESRESWEQESSDLSAERNLTEWVDLEGWIESRELWEQDNSEIAAGNNSMDMLTLEEWISSRESWEQENATELTNDFMGSIQEEWINNREAWEQK